MSDLRLETPAALFTARAAEGAAVVAIRGSFDHTVHALAVDFVDQVFAAFGPRLIMDLTGLDLLDSRGTGLIVNCWRRALGEGGRLALVGTERGATRILWITGLTTRIPVYPTVQDALDDLPPRT
ncbi:MULTISPECIES: STAS domain-containing protein [Streptosporangium]|uniref:Anti-sigma factor antagonist n=1 Tax=Streptosporangium brasiliense TaxID=47480 RepID=A0ABT9R6F2_9ACTN|nr:STAS domain-containing protein [Streptosporangium brasiliense]MDP9864822.1 anti-anti-sigma factor [Streptosporangium brasiliense]